MSGPDENTYFMDEVRDGFFIPGITKKFWAVAYKNMRELDKVCHGNGMEAFATWGTMLGAVRHGGFVPWDDDIDMMLDREDYNKLVKLGDEDKLPGEYWITDYSFNLDGNMVRAWTDCSAFVRTIEGCRENYGFPIVAVIDLFINDTIPDDPVERDAYRLVAETYENLSKNARDLDEQKKNGTKGLSKDEIVDEKLFLQNLKRMGEVLGIKVDPDEASPDPLFVRIYRALDEYCSGYKRGTGRQVSMMVYYLLNENIIFDKKLFNGFLDMPFEYGSMRVPIGYDGILRRMWSRYMYPVLGGGSHGYPAYLEMEKQLKEAVSLEYYNYHFDKGKYEKIKGSRSYGVKLSETIEDACAVFKEAHDYITESIMSGDEAVSDVLPQCQELAVSLGDRIETSDVNYKDKIVVLESYCDVVYKLYQIATGVSDTAVDSNECMEAVRSLREYESRIADFTKDIIEKKDVVLLCYRSEHWKSLHTIYEELQKREDVNTIVIRVPYYLVGYDGVVDKEHMIIETDGYPDGIEFTDYDKYDFENRHPAVIVFQCPYDNYHGSFSLHPFYFSESLYKYTDRLVFIPPFVTREIKDVDKLKITMSMFLSNPGVIYADTVIVQSSDTRDSYIEIMDSFIDSELRIGEKRSLDPAETDDDNDVSEEQKKDDTDMSEQRNKHDDDASESPYKQKQDIMDLDKKIIAAGSAVYDWESRRRTLLHDEKSDEIYDKSGRKAEKTLYDDVYDVPGNIMDKLRNPDGSLKKIIVFYISGSMVYSYGKDVLEKMREALFKLADREELLVWWYMDPFAREILKKYDKDAWVAFRKLRDDYAESGKGILDESRDDSLVREIADMMYGDACELMNHLREQGKPVLWQTPGVALDQEDVKHDSWTADTIMAVEGDWCLDTFVELAEVYEVAKPEYGNAARIVEEILRQ